MSDEIELKTIHKEKESDGYRKRGTMSNKVKPVENTSKSLLSFLKRSPMQKTPPSQNLKTMHKVTECSQSKGK